MIEGVESKRTLFVCRPASQDQKGLSDTNRFLTPLACEILFKQILFFSLILFLHENFHPRSHKVDLNLSGPFEPNFSQIEKMPFCS